MVVIELNPKIGEIRLVFATHPLDKLLRRDPFLLRPEHDRRTVRVISTDVIAFLPAHFLISHPNIGLYVFNEMTDVDRAIGVR